MNLRHWEDFAQGEALPAAETVVDAADAERFAASFGGLPNEWPSEGPSEAVPGLYVATLAMRLVVDSVLGGTASLGASAIDDVTWPEPVRPGDRLRIEGLVTAVRASRSRPDMGIVNVEFSLRNQIGACVMTQSNAILVRRRSAGGSS